MFSCAKKEGLPGDQIRARLSNGILERACDGEGSADAQAEAQDAAVELPQAVLEPVSASQALETSSARRHLGLVGEEAIENQRVDGDDGGGGENDVYAEPDDGDAFLDGEGIVEGVVFEGEVLVEGRDLVDQSEDANEYAWGSLDRAIVGRWSCAGTLTIL